MDDSKNTILAIALCLVILVSWHYFVGAPEADRQRQAREAELARQQQTTEQQQTGEAAPGSSVPTPGSNMPAPSTSGTPTQSAPTSNVPGAVPGGAVDRGSIISGTTRIEIDTPRVRGSINLTGGRIDDIILKSYHETVDDRSPQIELFSPSGAQSPYYAEYGWVAASGSDVAVPGKDTVWSVADTLPLTPDHPVTLSWDNGAGFTFERVYSIDENYMVDINQTIRNEGSVAATLFPYALISRHGTPEIQGFFILHEGLIGYFGEEGLEEVDYDDIAETKLQTYEETGGWIGITDKYWAAVLIPDQEEPYTARMTSFEQGNKIVYQTDYLLGGREVSPGSAVTVAGKLFAGAKVTSLIDNYQARDGVTNFELLIDWGWFYFLTKPLYYLINWFYQLIGNFGVAILAVTVIIKLVLFPLANKSYVSMSRMKLVQPEMVKIRERYGDDKPAQQKAMMELYKKEKINPMAGCLPILVQIPIFFALYKVLFVTIEMRHAPFFGWIQDLAAPDPTSITNLFGLMPWGAIETSLFGYSIGFWPILMAITMFLQMRLNPPPPDPTQAMIFNWMPFVFLFLLAGFPAGLVIYWAWNNFLSIIQQATIMKRQGVPIDMWNNVKAVFSRKASTGEAD